MKGWGKKADREVTVQYLQQDRIARDFANYLALYEKYQMDRQLEEALEYGKISEDMVEKRPPTLPLMKKRR